MPKELKVEDSRQGVRRGEQGRIVTIGKCARYAETSLKLLSTINEDHVTAGDLNDLIVINVAMLRYLQEEHALVHVNGSFGDGVERIYRNFRRNTSVFPPDVMRQNLEDADVAHQVHFVVADVAVVTVSTT